MLAIQKYIHENGLQKTVADFSLILKENGDLILLKYNQIDSDFSKEEVQDCRGLILHKDTYEVVSMSFRRFFNYGETQAHTINWDTANILEKLDGSIISLYFYNNEWITATSGTIDGNTPVGSYEIITFSRLFWKAIEDATGLTKVEYTKDLKTGYTYVYELCIPYNIVVTPHTDYTATLLTIRNISTLKEIPYNELSSWDMKVPIVKIINLSLKLDVIIESLKDKPFSEEGYVVCDANFNRIKIKNPTYLLAHRLKSKSSFFHIIGIIKENETEEFAATFSERKEELFALHNAYHNLAGRLCHIWMLDLCQGHGFENRKDYAAKVLEVTKEYGLTKFTGFFFTAYD